MKIVITDSKKIVQFTNVLRQLSNIVNEINLYVNKDGIYMQGMDSAQISLLELTLTSEWFDEYETKKSEVLGIHTQTLFKVLSCMEEPQVITMSSNNGDSLEITFEKEGTIPKYFVISLIDFESEVLTIPEVEYELDLTMNVNKIQKLLSQLSIFGETMDISYSDTNMELKTSGDLGKMTVLLTDDLVEELSIEEDIGNKTLSYSLKYFNELCKFTKVSKDLTMHITGDIPLKICYLLGTKNDNLKLYLAPKVVE